MKDQLLVLLVLLLIFLMRCSGGDTADEDEDTGVHQLRRLAELLTSRECEELLRALSRPEDDVFLRLKRLLPQNNDLHLLRARGRRDAPDADDKEAECVAALEEWLRRNGGGVFSDRMTRALRHVGRSDIATEVGKNINQDQALGLRRYVEGYHTHAMRLHTLPARPGRKRRPGGRQKETARRVMDLTWRDLDLVLERAPVLGRVRGPLDAAQPLLYVLLLGTGGTFVLTLLILHAAALVLERGRPRGPPGPGGAPDWPRGHMRRNRG